jgi:hypothetical protein
LSLQDLERVWPALLQCKTIRPPRVDWSQIARSLGCSLPTDFVQLSESYPRLVIDDYLAVMCPSQGNEQGFVRGIREDLIALDAIDTTLVSGTYLPYPAEGGLLPWGSTPDGDVLYWRTVGESPDEWTVVVAPRDYEWHEFDLGLTGYLAGLISGEVPPDGLPSDFPGDCPDVEVDEARTEM